MSDRPYREWREYPVIAGGRTYQVATKPGVISHGRADAAAHLLAEHVLVNEGETIVHLNCGNGLAGAASRIAGKAGTVVLADRNVLSVEATRRTLAANGLAAVAVVAGHGASAIPGDLLADVVTIRIPQERVAILQLLASAFSRLRRGGSCYIAGATNEGINTAARTMETLFGNAVVLARDSSHRVIRAVKRTDDASTDGEKGHEYLEPDAFHEQHAELRGEPYTFYSRPGVFSWDHVDEATVILAEAMRVERGERVLDLGCGSGILGIVASGLSGGGPLTMVDVDTEAVRSAHRSAVANDVTNFRTCASDIAGAVLDERFDVVVTNPPFHVGKATDLSVPMQFIGDAWEVLSPGGRLLLVANRTLPYENAIRHRFGAVESLHDGPRFKVLSAVRGSSAS
ncbi:MAG: methyltransferase [Gemmatimonadaceae bacterium]|nr:methyltransferase [Gemmatimonadaceae bacterium]